MNYILDKDHFDALYPLLKQNLEEELDASFKKSSALELIAKLLGFKTHSGLVFHLNEKPVFLDRQRYGYDFPAIADLLETRHKIQLSHPSLLKDIQSSLLQKRLNKYLEITAGFFSEELVSVAKKTNPTARALFSMYTHIDSVEAFVEIVVGDDENDLPRIVELFFDEIKSFSFDYGLEDYLNNEDVKKLFDGYKDYVLFLLQQSGLPLEDFVREIYRTFKEVDLCNCIPSELNDEQAFINFHDSWEKCTDSPIEEFLYILGGVFFSRGQQEYPIEIGYLEKTLLECAKNGDRENLLKKLRALFDFFNDCEIFSEACAPDTAAFMSSFGARVSELPESVTTHLIGQGFNESDLYITWHHGGYPSVDEDCFEIFACFAHVNSESYVYSEKDKKIERVCSTTGQIWDPSKTNFNYEYADLQTQAGLDVLRILTRYTQDKYDKDPDELDWEEQETISPVYLAYSHDDNPTLSAFNHFISGECSPSPTLEPGFLRKYSGHDDDDELDYLLENNAYIEPCSAYLFHSYKRAMNIRHAGPFPLDIRKPELDEEQAKKAVEQANKREATIEAFQTFMKNIKAYRNGYLQCPSTVIAFDPFHYEYRTLTSPTQS